MTSQVDRAELEMRYAEAMARAERAEARAAKAEAALDAQSQGVVLRAAAEEVRHSEQLMHAVFTRSTDAMLLIDDEGNYVDANPAAAEMFGVKKHVLLRKAVGAYNTDPASARATFERLLAAGGGRGQVQVYRGEDVRTVDFAAAANIRAGLHLVVLRDVTARQEAEAERDRLIASLQFERGRLGALLEKAPSFIVVLRGQDMVIEIANDAYKDMVGRSDLVGRTLADAIPEFAAQGFLETARQVLETGTPFHARQLPIRIARVPGREMEVRYVNVMTQALTESDGARTGLFVHGVDVTEETAAQNRVRAEFNAVPVPIYAWQRVHTAHGEGDFHLLDYNDAANQLSKGTISDFVGRSFLDVFSGDDEMATDLKRCIETGETFQRESERVLASTGDAKRLLLTFAAAPPDVVLVHAEDITERRKLEVQLRQAQKMEAIGRLAGGIAHDFNNLLTVILSYTQLVLGDLRPDDPMAADLQEVRMAGDRAVELTKQLLAFSRQQVLQPRVLKIDDTLRGVEKMLRRILGEAVELTLELGNSADIEADPGQIEQVILNLALNARDAMPEGGRLTLATSNVDVAQALTGDEMTVAPGRYVLLSVKDTGTGMDAATRARIFEPFFTTKAPSKGTGLGLATVFGIVQQSRGAIRVESELGRGTTFSIYLPRTSTDRPRAASPSPPPSDHAQPGGTETLLVVEDDASVRALVTSVLRRAGYRVLEASNGQEALHVAEGYQGEPIAMLLTDVVMPKMNGRALVERLSVRFPDVRALFMSGYTNDDDVLKSVFESRAAFLQKPVTPASLLTKVREVLRSRRR